MALSDADLRKIAAHQEPRVLLHHEVVKFARAIEAEVRKQDTELIRQMLEALERAKKHHFTTSLPLVIENYGSRIKCANEGSIVWRDLVPSAITAARARLENT